MQNFLRKDVFCVDKTYFVRPSHKYNYYWLAVHLLMKIYVYVAISYGHVLFLMMNNCGHVLCIVNSHAKMILISM